MPIQVRVPIVILGFDLNEDRTDLGSGSKARCRATGYLYDDAIAQGYTPFIVVSPGRAPGKSAAQEPHTMAQMMQRYLIEYGVRITDIRVGRPVWGTRAELAEAARIIRQEKKTGHNVLIWAYVVSDKEHLPRIRILTRYLTRNLGLDWRWELYKTRTIPSWSLKETLKEYGKAFVEIFRGYRWHPQL